MNYTYQDSSNTNSCVMTTGSYAIVNGVKYPYLKNMRGNNTTIINGQVFVGGYELKNSQWRRTLRAIWHLWF